MFNTYIFQQSALVLLCLVLLIVCVFTVRYHRWLALRIVATLVAILSVAAALGLICA